MGCEHSGTDINSHPAPSQPNPHNPNPGKNSRPRTGTRQNSRKRAVLRIAVHHAASQGAWARGGGGGCSVNSANVAEHRTTLAKQKTGRVRQSPAGKPRGSDTRRWVVRPHTGSLSRINVASCTTQPGCLAAPPPPPCCLPCTRPAWLGYKRGCGCPCPPPLSWTRGSPSHQPCGHPVTTRLVFNGLGRCC